MLEIAIKLVEARRYALPSDIKRQAYLRSRTVRWMSIPSRETWKRSLFSNVCRHDVALQLQHQLPAISGRPNTPRSSEISRREVRIGIETEPRNLVFSLAKNRMVSIGSCISILLPSCIKRVGLSPHLDAAAHLVTRKHPANPEGAGGLEDATSLHTARLSCDALLRTCELRLHRHQHLIASHGRWWKWRRRYSQLGRHSRRNLTFTQRMRR